MKILKELYLIYSPSGHEETIQEYIRHKLLDIGISFDVDENGQTYCLNNPGEPLVVAHTDQVSNQPLTELFENVELIFGDGNLGADDKNGIWIILKLLKQYPNLNFVFSTCEEIGGNIQTLINEKNMSEIPYTLVFDRMGGKDIIGYDNGYCSQEFEDALYNIAVLHGYRPSMGIWSDCDIISKYVNCVNLSCGYYNAHTDKEYTIKHELINAFNLAISILESDLKEHSFEKYNTDWYYTQDVADWYDEDVCPDCGSELLEFTEGSNGMSGKCCLNCNFELFDHEFYNYPLTYW